MNKILNSKKQPWETRVISQAFERANENLKDAKDDYDFLNILYSNKDVAYLIEKLNFEELNMLMPKRNKLFNPSHEYDDEAELHSIYNYCSCQLQL